MFPFCCYSVVKNQISSAYRGNEVGCSGRDSGPGCRGGMAECLGEGGPHDCITGEEQAAAQKPQGDVEL